LKAPDEARVRFHGGRAWFTFSSQTRGPGGLSVEIFCGVSGWKLSTLVQFCTSFSCALSSVESLHISTRRPYRQSRSDIESADQEWLDFLRPFNAVKDIYLCEVSAQQISYMLEEVVEGRLTEVLPILQNIFLEEITPSRRI
jgi:hypothetical protein